MLCFKLLPFAHGHTLNYLSCPVALIMYKTLVTQQLRTDLSASLLYVFLFLAAYSTF
jgi:hypothetical protein